MVVARHLRLYKICLKSQEDSHFPGCYSQKTFPCLSMTILGRTARKARVIPSHMNDSQI